MTRYLLLILLAGLGASAYAETVRGAGSTFAEPLYKRWAEMLKAQPGGHQLVYEGVGSGEGIARISAGKVDFGASDEPLSRKELDQKGLRQFPVVMGAIVPVVNLPGIGSSELKLNGSTLAAIYAGKITQWRDAEIARLNPDIASKLPNLPIKPAYRADSSGSTFVLTYYLAAQSPDWRKGIGISKEMKGAMGASVSGTGGVVDFIKKNPGSLGYVDFGRAQRDKLTMAQLANRLGLFVAANVTSIQAAARFDSERALYDADPDFNLILSNNDTYNGWPLSTLTFALVSKSGGDSRRVFDVLLAGYKQGDASARELGYVPISDSMQIGIRKVWSKQFGYKISN